MKEDLNFPYNQTKEQKGTAGTLGDSTSLYGTPERELGAYRWPNPRPDLGNMVVYHFSDRVFVPLSVPSYPKVWSIGYVFRILDKERMVAVGRKIVLVSFEKMTRFKKINTN